MTEIEKLRLENAKMKKQLEVYKAKCVTFPERLKIARLNLGMTLAQLGKTIGVSQNAVSTYETGKCDPAMKTLIKIADALNVSLDWLCGRTDEMSGV